MTAILASLLVLLAAAVPDSGLGLRRPASTTRLTASGQVVESDGRSFARARISLERSRDPRTDPYAEFMSVGPLGAEVPQAPVTSAGLTLRFEPPRRRLRVTISTCERNTNLTIDEILTGRADSRSFMAQYRVSPFFDGRTRELWEALQDAPRVLGDGPSGPPSPGSGQERSPGQSIRTHSCLSKKRTRSSR